MLNIDESYAEGLRESLKDFVHFEGRLPSDVELESILWEEFELIAIYSEDLADLWKEVGCPDTDILRGYTSVKDAIKGVMSDVWYEELMPQARKYLGRLV